MCIGAKEGDAILSPTYAGHMLMVVSQSAKSNNRTHKDTRKELRLDRRATF